MHYSFIFFKDLRYTFNIKTGKTLYKNAIINSNIKNKLVFLKTIHGFLRYRQARQLRH